MNTNSRFSSKGQIRDKDDDASSNNNNNNNNNNNDNSSTLSSTYESKDTEDLQHMPLRPPSYKRMLTRQLSMCETPRDIAWERRRRQILKQERNKNGVVANKDTDDLTDEDLHELKGCIELGFGFNEEEGQKLCGTFPALDLYFAVNRQVSSSPVSTPNSARSTSSSSSLFLGQRSSSFGNDLEMWKICNPGDDPKQVKSKLRHWAQAVACSVMQSK